MPTVFAATLLATMLFAVPALAHEDPDLQIEEVSKHLAADPANASLYLRRGQLYRTKSQWPAALADFQTARRLDPTLAVVDLVVAETLLDAGDTALALAAADRFLVSSPSNSSGHIVRARILVAQGANLEAAAAFSRGIAIAKAREESQPDNYLARARAIAAAGDSHLDDAIASLDEGLKDLHNAIALELLAIELETRAKKWDAALNRIARIEKDARRKETWMARRGDVLAAAGRNDDARREYQAALAAIDKLPPNTRSVRATTGLADSLRSRITALAAPGAGQAAAIRPAAPASSNSKTQVSGGKP